MSGYLGAERETTCEVRGWTPAEACRWTHEVIDQSGLEANEPERQIGQGRTEGVVIKVLLTLPRESVSVFRVQSG
jgi:hypothetical protein